MNILSKYFNLSSNLIPIVILFHTKDLQNILPMNLPTSVFEPWIPVRGYAFLERQGSNNLREHGHNAWSTANRGFCIISGRVPAFEKHWETALSPASGKYRVVDFWRCPSSKVMQRRLIHPVNKVIRKIFRPFGSLTRSDHGLKKELRSETEDGTLFTLTTPSFGFQLGNKSTLSLFI